MRNNKVSKKRLRKIKYVELRLSRGDNPIEVREHALHFMKMSPEDVQRAFGKNIFGGSHKFEATTQD